eukprot:TRINITY_DN18888_c0_g1_i4.p2 TRINITY_DN18888_c0_g1~~TRINITY_DN18888_c0_g1_i4.p2  ORF type:complete len:253 (-),score=23.20 TRINITY_DN18888_c0_g1_i4:195-929(-)
MVGVALQVRVGDRVGDADGGTVMLGVGDRLSVVVGDPEDVCSGVLLGVSVRVTDLVGITAVSDWVAEKVWVITFEAVPVGVRVAVTLSVGGFVLVCVSVTVTVRVTLVVGGFVTVLVTDVLLLLVGVWLRERVRVIAVVSVEVGVGVRLRDLVQELVGLTESGNVGVGVQVGLAVRWRILVIVGVGVEVVERVGVAVGLIVRTTAPQADGLGHVPAVQKREMKPEALPGLRLQAFVSVQYNLQP